jgi:hypothetical protein
MIRRVLRFLLPFTLLLVLAACVPVTSAPATGGASSATNAPPIAAKAPAATTSANLPPAVEYNLGDATIIQSHFSEDSRFRHMPVRLNGVIAVPPGPGGLYPVVLILHGTHPGCPIPDGDMVDRWPCAPEVEQPNYRGFAFLASELAAKGYVALSININAQNTFGFGEGQDGERLQQLVDLHLSALGKASAGGPNTFGVDLKGRADLNHLALIGHSRGGDGAAWLVQSGGLGAPRVYASKGYGPVAGLVLVAPPVIMPDAMGADVPQLIILPACDGDVTDQSGKHYLEALRGMPEHNQPATALWLERANHNAFNSILPGDLFAELGRIDCQPLLAGDAQRDFLAASAADFLTILFGSDPQARLDAAARLGSDVRAPAPAELYGLPARVATLAAGPDRHPLFLPASEGELTTNRAGGSVTADGVTTFFCPEGYYTPFTRPGSEPCRRVNLTVPGQPAMAVISWEKPGAALRFALPAGKGDLSQATAISLRAAVDPMSPLNATGKPQSFSVRLTDGAGKTAGAATRPHEPALQFPPGVLEDDPLFGVHFSGRVPMTTIRLPLSDFAAVDLANIREIALEFGPTASGSLFIGDLEWVRQPLR